MCVAELAEIVDRLTRVMDPDYIPVCPDSVGLERASAEHADEGGWVVSAAT